VDPSKKKKKKKKEKKKKKKKSNQKKRDGWLEFQGILSIRKKRTGPL